MWPCDELAAGPGCHPTLKAVPSPYDSWTRLQRTSRPGGQQEQLLKTDGCKNLCASSPNPGVVTSSHVCHSFHHTVSSDPAKIKAMRTCGRENKRKSSEQHLITSGIKVDLSSRGSFKQPATRCIALHTDGWAAGKSKLAGRRTVSALCQHLRLLPITAQPRPHLIQRWCHFFVLLDRADSRYVSDTQPWHVFLIWSVCSKWW